MLRSFFTYLWEIDIITLDTQALKRLPTVEFGRIEYEKVPSGRTGTESS